MSWYQKWLPKRYAWQISTFYNFIGVFDLKLYTYTRAYNDYREGPFLLHFLYL